MGQADKGIATGMSIKVTLTYSYNLDPTQCCELLLSALQQKKERLGFRVSPYDDQTQSYAFQIWITSYRNTFSPIFYGNIEKDRDGSSLLGGFRISPGARIFRIVFVLGTSILIIFGAINAIFYGIYGSSPRALSNGIFNTLLGPLVIWVFFVFSRYFLGRNDENRIRRFLAQTFES
ncbi:MAG: hypothetical protein ABI947_14625 [Chloroflexota bacterium]